MAYLAPIHRPSSVRHSLKLRFLTPEEDCFVLAKANRLEIYDQTAEGLVLRHSKVIYGKITILKSLRPAEVTTDHLFVGTDRHSYFTLSWDASTKSLVTGHVLEDQSEQAGRDSQTQDRCVIDPYERFMAMELFEGIITLVPLKKKAKRKNEPEIKEFGHPILVRVSEMFVRSSTFLHLRGNVPEKQKPKMAIIYEDNQQKARLKVKELEYSAGSSGDMGTADFNDDDDVVDEVDISASHVIPVPAPAHGFLVLAETGITYVDETKEYLPVTEPLQSATIFVAWERVDDQRWLLADDYGQLYFLMLLLSGPNKDRVTGFKLDILGVTSRASVLTYLGGGYLFVGSHQGDSQVVKIQESGLEVVQTISNIGPILDFTVMDMGSRAGENSTNEFSSGQARIVTGSGAFQDGSLRSVRSGVGLEDLGSLGVTENVTNMFSIRSSSTSASFDTLFISLIDETRIFRFSPDGDVEEIDEFKGFITTEGTILATNVSDNRLVQCTSSLVRLIDLESGMIVSDWASPSGASIVAASANAEALALSISGVELVVLDLTSELRLRSQRKFGSQNQLSCVDVPENAPGACIVGFWNSSEISILKLDGLETIQSTQVSEEGNAVPRSVLLSQVLSGRSPTLFVAMADGNIVTYDVDTTDFELSGKKSTILGTQQASLRAISRGDGLYNVFAICEHPSLIYGSEERLVYSAITAEKASCICPFDSEAYPHSIAIASPDDVKISLVDTERTTHIQTLPIGESVRRIAYSTTLKAFGMGTINRRLEEGVEVVQSHFKLADEVVFKELDTYELNEDELVESVLRADLDQGPRGNVESFVVGTAYIEESEPDAVRGRILVFEVTQERKLKLVAENSLKGACRALASLDGMIVAALVKTVALYAFESGHLERRASYRTSTAPIDISVTENTIAVADIMKSISIVKYARDSNDNNTLLEVARHFQIAWSTALAPVDENTYLVSDAEGNLMVLRQNVNGVTADDRRRLEVTSEIQLGEMVNKIRRINVVASPDAVVVPRAFMATVDGSIYLFALIAPSKQDFLMTLQTQIAGAVKSPGDVDFLRYRGFRNTVRETPEPFRFVDGELIEKFLECEAGIQEEIVKGVGDDWSVEKVKAVVEELRRLC